MLYLFALVSDALCYLLKTTLMKKELSTPHVHFVLSENLLIATYKKGLHIDLDIAREVVRSRRCFTSGKTLAVLILNGGVVSMSKEAREYLASSEGTTEIRAAAIVLESVFGSVLGNFFLSVNKPEMPVRIFSRKHAAIRWLKKYTL